MGPPRYRESIRSTSTESAFGTPLRRLFSCLGTQGDDYPQPGCPAARDTASNALHFSHTWLVRGGPEGDLMELNGWSSPQMLSWHGASARSARARRTYDRVMADNA